MKPLPPPGTFADQFDALEVADERVHRQREDAPAPKGGNGRARGRLNLIVLDLDPLGSESLAELCARPGRRVRDEAKAVPVFPQAMNGIGRALNRLA